ncbi:RNA ligase family protein [Mesorhizobium sp. VK9D]|uniref:ATP-dependent DNA ligase n=1 Tax=Mesorhizobium australafricanum TaxID=3072311 RepID=UPI002A2403AE|nr:RNA ligase family protein [Mesorhizobium sp. VK9D]MDX8456336.1 RNA ligase family protein [Mesorhizobium sp. VK9D]
MGKRDKVDGDRLEFIPPQMPTLVEQPPEDEGWVHEAKLDGYRTQIIIDKGRVRLYSKNGRDWTTKYWPIALAVDLPCRAAILDGEVIVSGERGTPDSPALEAAIWNEPSRLVFVAFDILHLDGRNLAPLPLLQRKQALRQLVEPRVGKIQYSDHFEGDAPTILRAIENEGFDGIISKRADSPYRSGRSKTWLKALCTGPSDAWARNRKQKVIHAASKTRQSQGTRGPRS